MNTLMSEIKIIINMHPARADDPKPPTHSFISLSGNVIPCWILEAFRYSQGSPKLAFVAVNPKSPFARRNGEVVIVLEDALRKRK